MGRKLEIVGPEEDVSAGGLANIEESAQVARAQAEVQAAVILAKRFPRDETRARVGLEKSVDRLAFAEDAYYSFPRSNKEIFGPSINFAREWARIWGNIQYGYRIVQESDDERTIEGFAWDMETNTRAISQDTFGKSIQRKDLKTGVTKWVMPDERDLRELTERRAAIQMRNCLLRLAPRDLVDDLVDKARSVVKAGNDAKPIEQRRADCVKAFESMGVYQDRLEARLGKTMNEATPDDLAEFLGIYKAIKDGVAKIDEYFGDGKPKAKEEVKGEMTVGEVLAGKVESEKKPDGGAKKSLF